MRNSSHRVLGGLVLSFCLLLTPGRSPAEVGDCCQPTSAGTAPKSSDAFTILRQAVGRSTDCESKPCICDGNGDGGITVTDALLTLRIAVGHLVAGECPCATSDDAACTSANVTVRGGDLGFGWTGIVRDAGLAEGTQFALRMKRECSVTSTIECLHDADCPDGESCESTCDCNDDASCELSGPANGKRCLNDLESCDSNADCDQGIRCATLFGPPLPLSFGAIPFCMVNSFDGPVTGTADTANGEMQLSATLNSGIYLGMTVDQPCPTCGAPEDGPGVGDQFTCSGGPNDGDPCTVEGVTPDFGGTSSDCPPMADSLITGPGLTIPLRDLTTGTTTKTAQLPCKYFGFGGNPTVAGSNPKCTDRNGPADPVCSSNADCARCTLSASTACTSNADCGEGMGVCAEAPDQPVTCGFWCSCGFCDGNASLPCFESGDCPDGQACEVGPGAGTTPNRPQQRPNDCDQDHFICGGTQEELCATTTISYCSGPHHVPCASDVDCEELGGGACVPEAQPCFEPRITRSGSASPLGAYCAFENKGCTTNADCQGADDFCVQDSARPETVGLFCMPASASSAVNGMGGITGPGAIRLDTLFEVCRCGDSRIGCDEQCDDGNASSGDGCDDLCQEE